MNVKAKPANQKQPLILCMFRFLVNTALYLLAAALILLSLPRLFGYQFITVQSGSMLPALQVGGVCLVSPEKDGYGHLTASDIITYRMETESDTLVTHRVYSHNADGTYTTKGDANKLPDERPVSEGQILGLVRFHVPYMGYVVDRLNSMQAKAFLVGGCVLLALLSLLLDPGEPKKQKKPAHAAA